MSQRAIRGVASAVLALISATAVGDAVISLDANYEQGRIVHYPKTISNTDDEYQMVPETTMITPLGDGTVAHGRSNHIIHLHPDMMPPFMGPLVYDGFEMTIYGEDTGEPCTLIAADGRRYETNYWHVNYIGTKAEGHDVWIKLACWGATLVQPAE